MKSTAKKAAPQPAAPEIRMVITDQRAIVINKDALPCLTEAMLTYVREHRRQLSEAKSDTDRALIGESLNAAYGVMNAITTPVPVPEFVPA